MIGKQGGMGKAPTGGGVIQPKGNPGSGVVGGGQVATGSNPKPVGGNNHKLK